MPQKPQDIKLRFPAKGLVESQSFSTQPPGTTSIALNVVAFDPTTGRARGGSRSGLSKFSVTQVNGGSRIQEINSLAFQTDPDGILMESSGTIEIEAGINIDILLEGNQSTEDRHAVVAIAGGQLRYFLQDEPTEYNTNSNYRRQDIVTYLGRTYYCVADNGRDTSPALVQNPVNNETYWTETVWQGLTTTLTLDPEALQIFSEPFYGDLLIADGKRYLVADVGSDAMTEWTADVDKGQMPFDTQGVETVWDAASTYASGTQVMYRGNLYTSKAGSNTGNIPSSAPTWWEVVPNLDRCRLMAVCFGRVILSGLVSDPTNWFMSAVEDPEDWRYDPDTPTVQQAVAGNNADCGRSGDTITALIPFTDDVLIIGGTTTIERLSGDPADGGRRDRITATTGIAFGKAWCQSPDGTIYFVGSRGGVYQLHPSGSEPTRLTAFTIDEKTQDWDTDANIFRLVWDDRAIAVHVFVTPKAGAAETTHFTYDVRNQAWWPFEYLDNDYNPTAVHLLTANRSPEKRAILIGGWDGYVRWMDWDATMDDTQSIRSEVNIAQFTNKTIISLQGVLGKSSGHVNWNLMNGDTFDDGVEGLIVDHGSWRSGFNSTRWCRRYLDYGYLRLSSSEPWNMEEIAATIQDGGRTRDRMV